jgi:hypothetical protein
MEQEIICGRIFGGGNKVSKDTSKKIEKVYLQMLKKKSSSQRAMMGFSMYETAKMLSKADLMAKDPKAGILDIKIGLFNKFYSDDFDLVTRGKIIDHLVKIAKKYTDRGPSSARLS